MELKELIEQALRHGDELRNIPDLQRAAMLEAFADILLRQKDIAAAEIATLRALLREAREALPQGMIFHAYDRNSAIRQDLLARIDEALLRE